MDKLRKIWVSFELEKFSTSGNDVLSSTTCRVHSFMQMQKVQTRDKKIFPATNRRHCSDHLGVMQ